MYFCANEIHVLRLHCMFLKLGTVYKQINISMKYFYLNYLHN